MVLMRKVLGTSVDYRGASNTPSCVISPSADVRLKRNLVDGSGTVTRIIPLICYWCNGRGVVVRTGSLPGSSSYVGGGTG